ncbi:unnamed protein product [Rotaria sordida]|uniref:Uncharacterized protein n=1 Tax=Rotaria sordida TaxID=392033 RepID=A0A814TRS3_9BILA|nr:unnamed protein product [Rotaria sordida]
MYESFNNTSIFRVPPYIQVAKQVRKEIPDKFRIAVRQSSSGENAFRKGLYEMCKRSEFDEADYLYVYACFEQVTPDYVDMFFKVIFKCSWSWSSDHFAQLRFVSERQSNQLLIDALQSSLSLTRRCAAAKLLVHLTVVDQVSVIEVQNLLSAAIDDPYSQQFLNFDHQDIRADWKLKNLLIRLMVKPSNRQHCGATIDMINENSYNPVPAAVFQAK